MASLSPHCFLWVVCLTLAAGCGTSVEHREELAQTGLKEIAKLLKDYGQQKKRAPEKLADLQPLSPLYPGALKALETSEVVLIYGARPATTPNGAKTIVAYEKKAPREGGLVLLLDGTIRHMSVDEFNNAPKAKGS
jgi:hypothetical protein